MAQLTSGATPGRVVASAQSTMPQTAATKKAYACSQPRIGGLPMSTGRSRARVGAVVTTAILRLRNRRVTCAELHVDLHRRRPKAGCGATWLREAVREMMLTL